jgi:hypothetical protein
MTTPRLPIEEWTQELIKVSSMIEQDKSPQSVRRARTQFISLLRSIHMDRVCYKLKNLLSLVFSPPKAGVPKLKLVFRDLIESVEIDTFWDLDGSMSYVYVIMSLFYRTLPKIFIQSAAHEGRPTRLLLESNKKLQDSSLVDGDILWTRSRCRQQMFRALLDHLESEGQTPRWIKTVCSVSECKEEEQENPEAVHARQQERARKQQMKKQSQEEKRQTREKERKQQKQQQQAGLLTQQVDAQNQQWSVLEQQMVKIREEENVQRTQKLAELDEASTVNAKRHAVTIKSQKRKIKVGFQTPLADKERNHLGQESLARENLVRENLVQKGLSQNQTIQVGSFTFYIIPTRHPQARIWAALACDVEPKAPYEKVLRSTRRLLRQNEKSNGIKHIKLPTSNIKRVFTLKVLKKDLRPWAEMKPFHKLTSEQQKLLATFRRDIQPLDRFLIFDRVSSHATLTKDICIFLSN